MAGFVMFTALGLLLAEANPWGSEASRDYAKSAHEKRTSGDVASAYDIFQQGLHHAVRTGNVRGQIKFLNSLGGCRFLQYDYREALKYWLEGRQLAEKNPGSDEEHAALLFNIASLYVFSSNLEAAEDALRQGNEILKRVRGVPYYAATLHLLRAKIAANGRSWAAATEGYREAIRAADALGDDSLLALVLNHSATSAVEAGDLETADRQFHIAFRIRKLRKDPDLVYTCLGLAQLFWARGDLARASAMVEAAQRIADESNRPMARHQIHDLRARILHAQHRFASAHGEYMRAIANIRFTRADLLPADLFRINNEASLADLYDGMLRNAMDWYKSGSAPLQLAAEAFLASEEWKASVASRSEEDRKTLRSRLHPEYWQKLAEVRELERRAITSQYAPAKVGEDRLRTLRVQLAEMESYAGVRPFSGLLIENFSPSKPLILFRDSLGSDSVLISFHLGRKATIRWTLTQSRLDWKELPPRNELATLTETFSQALRTASESDRRLGLELYEKVFGGLSSEARESKRWLLALDDALLELPVAALSEQRPVKDGSLEYLVENRSLEIVTGAQALLSSDTGDWNGAFVGIGDAVYNTADPRWAQASRVPAGSSGIWGSLMAAERPAGGERLQLPRLASSRAELQASAKAWGGTNRLLLGPDANRGSAVASIETGASVIHFATHFLQKPDSRDRALLVLSLDAKGQPDFFSPADAVHVKVPDSLVVLSGCHSAAGAQVPAAGMIGMTRAWLLAGATGVIASLWPTPDDTGAIFQIFYRELHKEAPSSNGGGVLKQASARQRRLTLRNAADALRRAQLEMLRTQTWRAMPKYWGTYQLIGRAT